MAGWVKALLFLLGGLVAAFGTAYVTGMLDPWLQPQAAQIAPETMPSASSENSAKPADGEDAAPAEGVDASTDAGEEPPVTSSNVTTDKQARLTAPIFDVLRVEPDGSVLVAGEAGAGTLVELLSGTQVLGSVTAGEGGDFVIVLDEKLKPGDYQLSLRAAISGEEAVLSSGSAVISIPQPGEEDQLLAMIDEPGAPAQLITSPQPAQEQEEAAPAAVGSDKTGEPGSEIAVSEETGRQMADGSAADEKAPIAEIAVNTSSPSKPADEALSASDAPQTPPASQPDAAPATMVIVEAVEIEGDKVFVAGRATPGHNVRIYADMQMLGEAAVSEGGRFLVEAKRDLAVGDYMIRADLIGKDGEVLARAAVPFAREPGEAIAAVAPSTSENASSAGEPVTEDGKETASSSQEIIAQQGASADTSTTGPQSVVKDGAASASDSEEIATAAPLERAEGAVIIRRGDSLWRISRRVYGHGIRYSTIYLANQDQISNPDLIWPGQVFALPRETPEGDQADLDAIGDQSVEPGSQPTSQE